MGALLALASALSSGLSDVVGGLAARRMRPALVALLGQLGGLVAVGVAAPLLSPPGPGPASLAWGALSGVGTGLGMAFLFRGIRRGAMSVVVPVSAVGGIALPVLVGVALLGDRPSVPTWVGIALVLPGLWLVSRPGAGVAAPDRGSVGDGLVAGAGIAVQYLALARAGPDAGLRPVLAGRVTAVLAVGILAVTLMRRTPTDADTGAPTTTSTDDAAPTSRAAVEALGSGVLAAAALAAYAAAVLAGSVTVAVVLSSLYPLVPTLVGLVFLGERLSRRQVLGLTTALVAAVLISVS